MSLYRQLWVAIALLLAVVFAISVWITTLSARDYLAEQLSIKNADNASALALSMSQQGADQVLLELTLAAQFDTGFYEYISLTDPKGNNSIVREDETPARGAPLWFMRLLPIRAEPGVATLQAGWKQAGTLTVRSHSRFAYKELWQGTLRQAGIFLLAAVFAGMIGTRMLKRILHPLSDVVRQADALASRRFITTDEPATLEFRQLARSMNNMSQRVQTMLEQETARLERWQQEAQVDPVTGLLQRQPFLHRLATLLESPDAAASGSLFLVRLRHLARLNRDYGRGAIDDLLNDLGENLRQHIASNPGWAASRLNGSDIAVVAPGELEAEPLAEQLLEQLRDSFSDHRLAHECESPGAATLYHHGDSITNLLARLDATLAGIEEDGRSVIVFTPPEEQEVQPMQQQAEHWRTELEDAFSHGWLGLARYPLLGIDDALIHFESPVTLHKAGETLRAAQFLPWVHRLKFDTELDREVVTLALARMGDTAEELAVNLSAAALYDGSFCDWLDTTLQERAESASRLWLEIPEGDALQDLPALRRLCSVAQNHGVKVGIEHAGHRLAQLGQLHDVGLDYLKVDGSFIRDIAQNTSNQTFLSALCTLGHALGLQVFAEGVQNETQWLALKPLGFDGGTGPGVVPPL